MVDLCLPEFDLKDYPYRVYVFHNTPHVAAHIPVKTIQEAINLIELMTIEDLKRDEITSNVFGLLEWCEQTGQWEDWYDSDGNDIIDIIDQL